MSTPGVHGGRTLSNRFNALSSVAQYRGWHIGVLNLYWMDRKMNGGVNDLVSRVCPIMHTELKH